MIVATYNVNSINARLENLLTWLKNVKPDVVLLQEIKSEFETFPFFELQSLGYYVKILGQKSYNGVAVLSKYKIKNVQEGLPDFEDSQSRYLEVWADVGGRDWCFASIYLPNGNPPYNNPDDDSKYDYKLQWMDALILHAKSLLKKAVPCVLGGDFNVILSPKDVYDEKPFLSNALYRPEVKAKLRSLIYMGFYDAFRTLRPHTVGYTYWDYAGKAFQSDMGMRIDYLLLSPMAVDCLLTCDVDKTPRGMDKPSDHTPLLVELRENGKED